MREPSAPSSRAIHLAVALPQGALGVGTLHFQNPADFQWQMATRPVIVGSRKSFKAICKRPLARVIHTCYGSLQPAQKHARSLGGRSTESVLCVFLLVDQQWFG
jgi:hypothetical protein